jgi:hypothetical protein
LRTEAISILTARAAKSAPSLDSQSGSRNSWPMTSRNHLVLIASIVLLAHAAVAQFEPPEQAPTQDVNSALGALSILPPEYQNFVVKVSADNGTPDPPQWYFLAYRGNPQEGLFSISIANGQIIQEKPTFNLGELFKNPSPIAIERITIDSPAAFEIAEQFAAANDRHLKSVSYVLQQSGPDSAPVWKIWCYDRGGDYFGYIEIAATDGTVISTDGLPRTP